MNHSFLVEKNQLPHCQFVTTPIPEIGAAEVLLQVERYTFSSNNITYGLMGEKARYWQFFPAEEPFGRIPVWGYARVVASNVEALAVGQRFFGYLPMSNYFKVKVDKVAPHGFFDRSEHRKDLHLVYNFYTRSVEELAEKDYALVIRPTFSTAFLLYHFLKDHHFFKAKQILLTSASSKTALSLAYLLRINQASDEKKITALTSPRNVDFVKSTAYYDQVLAYPDLEREWPKMDTAIVDFAGNAPLMENLHQALGAQWRYTARVGFTNWQAERNSVDGPQNKLFFAPDHGQKRYKEWGAEKTTRLINTEMAAFADSVADWMTLEVLEDQESIQNFYQALLEGTADPAKGYLVQMG